MQGSYRWPFWLALAWLTTFHWLSLAVVADAGAFSFGTEFLYQGRLHHDGAPADGFFDVTFELYDQRDGGTLLGRRDRLGVEVRGGILTTELDFGHDVRSSQGAWIQVDVRPAGTGPWSRLEPRQLVTGEGTGCTVDEDVTINGGLFVDAPGAVPDIVTACCNDVDNGGAISINGSFGALLLDSNEIQAQTLGAGSDLLLNADGGDVGIGVGTAAAPLNIPAGPDAEPGSGGALVVGPPSGTNLAIDNNEIMVRNGGATSTLFLNNDGGRVAIGGSLDIGLEVVTVLSDSSNFTASCPVGKSLLAGSCAGGTNSVNSSIPESSTTWRCVFDGSGTNEIYAICARIEW